MVTADDVRRVGLALPRAYEVEVRGRSKLRVGQLVFVAFSRDELSMGFGFPRIDRDGLVASDPDTFFLPPTGDLRFPWVCAHLSRLEREETRELVTDAWRLCVPRMLHDLPDLPSPAAAAWSAAEERRWDELGVLLDPEVHWTDGSTQLTGRAAVLAHLRDRPRPRPPHEVAVRAGRLTRWLR